VPNRPFAPLPQTQASYVLSLPLAVVLVCVVGGLAVLLAARIDAAEAVSPVNAEEPVIDDGDTT